MTPEEEFAQDIIITFPNMKEDYFVGRFRSIPKYLCRKPLLRWVVETMVEHWNRTYKDKETNKQRAFKAVLDNINWYKTGKGNNDKI